MIFSSSLTASTDRPGSTRMVWMPIFLAAMRFLCNVEISESFQTSAEDESLLSDVIEENHLVGFDSKSIQSDLVEGRIRFPGDETAFSPRAKIRRPKTSPQTLNRALHKYVKHALQ